MGKNTETKRYQRCILSFMLVVSLIICGIPENVSVYATMIESNDRVYSGLTQIYDGDGYIVEFCFTDVWQGAGNIRLIVKNSGTDAIENWALSFEMNCEITNIWNALIYSKVSMPHDNGDSYQYIIKNSGYNMSIPIGGQIEVGMSIKFKENNSSYLLPTNFIMVQKNTYIPNSDYSVNTFIYGDTKYNYTGFLVIKNNSNIQLEKWTLSFSTDIYVIDFHTVELIEHQESHYLIKNRGCDSQIKPGEQVFLGFTAKGMKERKVIGTITDAQMMDIRICEINEPTNTVSEPITSYPTITEEPTAIVTEPITLTPLVTEEPTPSLVLTGEPTGMVTDIPDPTTITDKPTPSLFEEYTKEELWFDKDGDGLPLVYELELETDPEKADTDGDGIIDYIEILNGLDPLTCNSEFESDTDSDFDDLSDAKELYIYHTDPLNPDTDGDELEDGFEALNGFDPLKMDTDENGIYDGEEKFEQTFQYSLEKSGYEYEELVNSAGTNGILFGVERHIPVSIGAVTEIDITTDISNDINKQFNIRNIYGESVMASNIPGLIGVPFDISTDVNFESATVVFKYDDSKLGECNEENLRVVWYDEDEGHFVILENAILDTENNIITYETTHFCIISIVDYAIWKKTWETWVLRYSKRKLETNSNIALELCIDVGSDFFKENELAVKDSLKRFVNAKLSKDNVSVVSFYKRYVLADEGAHFVSGFDKNEHMEKIELVSTKSKIISYLSDVIQPQTSFCSTLGILSSIENYFENSSNVNNKKAVIMLSTALIDISANPEFEEKISYLRDNNIELYQTYIGEIPEKYKNDLMLTLRSTGGFFREITPSSNYVGILKTILNKVRGYDVVFLIDSGSNRIKEEWDRFISGIGTALNADDYASRYGLINVYSGKKSGEGGGEVSVSDWYNEQSFYKFTSDTYLLNNEIDALKVMEQPCTLQSMEYGLLADNFDLSPFGYSEGVKTIILITETVLSSEDVIKKNIEDKIPLYVIYVGPDITDPVAKRSMINLIERTGGLVSFPKDNNYIKINSNGTESGLSAMEQFNDSISYMITACLHTSDSRDSDNDGIPDCDELYGMLGGVLEVIHTNPHNPDSDKDGILDGMEMGNRLRVNSYFKDILGSYIDEETDLFRLFDKNCSVYVMKSDPRSMDTDGDGYFDNVRPGFSNNAKDPRPLISDVDIHRLFSVKFVPVYEELTSSPFYGGDQDWFDEEPDSGVIHSILDSCGCGLVAAENLSLYLALRDKTFIIPEIAMFFKDIYNGIIHKDEFVKWGLDLSNLNDAPIYFVSRLGLWIEEIPDGLKKLYNKDELTASFRKLDWFTSDSLKKEIENDIITMLDNDIPVIFSIGLPAPWSEDINLYYLIDSTDKDYQDILDLYQFKPKQDVSVHVMTITEFVHDKVTGKKYIGVSSWGAKYYIDYDFWIENEYGTRWDGILKIKKND